jgi:hypothetical protein
MATDGGPTPRWDHSLAADDDGRQLMLFGGRGADSSSLGDTWIYSFADRTWSQVGAAGPEPRFGHATVVDQKNRRMVLFGGQSADVFYNDSWLFDFASLEWSQVDTGDSALPSPRYGLAGVLTDRARMVVSHGFTFEGRFDDTWELDLKSGRWEDVSPDGGGVRPLKRCLHEQAWEPDSNTMLLYGGCSSGFGPCPQGDLWRYDPESRSWTDITPGAGPAPRTNPALVYDRTGARMLLIGGSTDSGYAADIWAGTTDDDAFIWTELSAGGEVPTGRSSHDAVITRGDVYVFGGTSDSGVLGDLWKLSLGD